MMEVFDGQSWAPGPQMHNARYMLAAVALDGWLYAIGGSDPSAQSLSTVERLRVPSASASLPPAAGPDDTTTRPPGGAEEPDSEPSGSGSGFYLLLAVIGAGLVGIAYWLWSRHTALSGQDQRRLTSSEQPSEDRGIELEART